MTHKELEACVERKLDLIEMKEEEYLVSPMSGPHLRCTRLPQIQSLRANSEQISYQERLSGIGSFIREHIQNLRVGLDKDRVSSAKSIQRVSRQLMQVLTLPTPESVSYTHLTLPTTPYV